MSTRPLIPLSVLLFLTMLAACDQATYTKEKVTQSVIDLCKNEYDLDVDVQIIGSTLGVHIPIEGLVDEELKLDEDAGEKIEDVALSIHRVAMSTDRPLKFYTLVARDTKTIGAEFVLTGFTYDVVRVRLLDISRGEYHKRILRDFRFNPVLIGDVKIRELFDAINENSPLIQGIKPVFYPTFTIGQNNTQKIEVVDIIPKEISEQEGLFYIKTKEYYEPLPHFQMYRAIFPPGFDNEYLILTNISMPASPIKEIVAKYFFSSSEIRKRDIKEIFDQYEEIGYIGVDGLPSRDLETDWFLSRQIVRRIRILFEEDKRLKKKFTVQESQGSVKNKIFQFKFNITAASGDPLSDRDTELIFSKILKMTVTALHRYSFEDFEGAEFTDTGTGGITIYLSKEELEKFRKGRIRIKDILTHENSTQ